MADEAVLVYPEHVFNPMDFVEFVELGEFTKAWSELKLTVDDLFVLQTVIMCDPAGGPVVSGTGGLRKLRFAPPGWKVGKRGVLRIF